MILKLFGKEIYIVMLMAYLDNFVKKIIVIITINCRLKKER